ncbi:MAG: hypothetical protein LBK02_00650 [Treponema sp.]|jgi:hypothetical protein|nr:hypothetical protein [Treponema sp.]
MTLSGRNAVFKAGILIAAAGILIIIAASFVVMPVYPLVAEKTAQRAPGIIQSFIGHFFDPNPYASFAATAGAGIYALVTLVLIYYFFEKTQSPEILFFALFVFSFSFEVIRVIVPLNKVYTISPLYLVMAFRTLLFSRYFGIFSLFAASVYAAGLEVQKQRNIILVITAAAMVIVMGVPIDTLSWDSSFSMINGDTSMFRMIEAGVLLITLISFLISAYSRGSREYIFIGAGSFLVFLGRNILLSADTWISPIPALVFLILGTWLICTQLHHVYLWL